MTYSKCGHHYFLRFFKGEDIMNLLQSFARERGISAAHFHGLGAVSEARLGYYHLDTKEYDFTNFNDGNYELVSLNGNITLYEGEPFLHMHGAIAGVDLAVKGGHIDHLVVGVTVEIHLSDYETLSVERLHDPDIGLKLCQLEATHD